MYGKEPDGVDETLQRRRKLSANGRSTRVIRKNAATHTERNRATNAKNVERLQEHRLKRADGKQAKRGYIAAAAEILTYIPQELLGAVAAIEQVLEAVQPYAANDIGDWVLCSSHPGAEDVDEIVQAANEKFGGCPARAIYNHFDIEIDPSRVICKPPQIGEWTVVQCFRDVSLDKLLMVFQITTAYWPSRRLQFVATREQFEATAGMFEFVEDAHFKFNDGSGGFDDKCHSFTQAIDHFYLTYRDRFNCLTRYSTEQDRVDIVAKWGQT